MSLFTDIKWIDSGEGGEGGKGNFETANKNERIIFKFFNARG
jgi:hypothetical protein